MKYGTQLGSLGRKDVREALDFAKELGCQGLEVDLPVAAIRIGKATLAGLVADAEKLRKAFDAAGVEFISLTPGILLKSVQTPEIIQATCRVAQVLGVRQIRMFFAPHVRWGGPNSKLDEWLSDFDGTHDSRYWLKRNAEELDALLGLSAGYDVRYVFELHHGYVVNSASAAMRMLDRFPPSRVGILMDPGNMVFEGNEGWRNSVQIMGEYLGYIHCKNGVRRLDGQRWAQEWSSLEEGVADYPELITALKDAAFDGYLSIEDLRGGLTPEERIGNGIRYLKGLAASTKRVMPI